MNPKGRVVASRLTAEDLFRLVDGVFGGQSGNGTDLFRVFRFSPYHYFTNAPYSFVRLSTTLYNDTN
jgi:hypothetical protein